ncbi:hypothetical protein D3C78_1637720 [compost metagenome]
MTYEAHDIVNRARADSNKRISSCLQLKHELHQCWLIGYDVTCLIWSQLTQCKLNVSYL